MYKAMPAFMLVVNKLFSVKSSGGNNKQAAMPNTLAIADFECAPFSMRLRATQA